MLIILFLLIWIIFNGKVTLEIVLFGLGIGIVMYLFVCKFMGYKPSYDKMIVRLIIPGIAYIGILFWEIVKANLSTMKTILSSKYDNEPALVEFEVPLTTRFAQIILANSITLTPGTITVNLDGNHFQVHCLDTSMADGLDSSVFVKRLMKMEDIICGEKRVEK